MISNTKIESQLISTLIADNGLLLEFYKDINPNLFFKPENKTTIEAIIELQNNAIIPDFDSLENYFDKKNIKIDIFEFINPLGSNNFSHYIKILKELTYKRELKTSTHKLFIAAEEKNKDVFELNQELNDATNKLTNILTTNEIEDNISLIKKVVKDVERSKTEKGITGCITGFTDIDRITGGWQDGNLIILAARPGMGKTSLAICQALNSAIDYDKNVLFFSLEMSGKELMKRQFSLISDIPLSKFSNDESVNFVELNKRITPLENSFKIFDKCYDLYNIKAECRRENNKQKVDAIYIDYLQLIRHKVDSGRNKENEVSEISRELKLLAKDLDVPIICLSQLSRAVENRGGSKIPKLSDLRDSGSIEQDADIVQFIYRPEYYDVFQDENGVDTKGKALIVFAKNRNGALTTIALRFEAELTRFSTIFDENINDFSNIDKLEWLSDED